MAEIGTFEFVAPLWLYPGEGGWRFVTVPTDVADEIADLTAGNRRGFGSVKVTVTVGGTSWQTSVFPDGAKGTYVLPMKKSVRNAEGLEDGDDVPVRLELSEL